MAGLHVDPQEHRPAARHGGAQPRDPLGRLPVGHPRVGEPAERQDRRVVLGGDVVVGRVRQDRPEGGLALARVAPFGPFRRRQRQLRVQHGVEHVDEGHVGDDPGEQLRREVGHRPHQHPAGRPAVGDDALLGRVAGLDQRPRAGDEVREGVGLLLALAVEVPAPALLGAAADMGDRVDEAAVDEAQQVRAERRRHQRSVGAVAVEQQRRAAVEGEVSAMQQRDRHLLAVGRGGEEPPGHVGGRVVTARHRLPLAQEPGAGRAVVVPGLRRGRHRRVDEADRGRVEGETGPQAEGVGLLGEGDRVLGTVGEVAHDDPRPGRSRSPAGSGGRPAGAGGGSSPRTGAARGRSSGRGPDRRAAR